MEGHGSASSREDECLDKVFDALRDRYRRRILAGLVERSPQSVDGLLPPDTDGDVDRNGLRVAVHHGHLPKLDDAGFVEWDGGSRVRRGPRFDKVASVIAVFEENRDQLPGEWP